MWFGTCNPALDTLIYKVHFLDVRTEKLAVNAIAEVRHSIPSIMLMVMIASCLMLSCTSKRIHCWCSLRTVRWRSAIARRLSPILHVMWLGAGSSVANGKTPILSDRNCQTSKSPIYCKWLNLHVSHLLQVNQLLMSQWVGSSTRETSFSSWKFYLRFTHKYGLGLPKTVEHAYTINKAMGTTSYLRTQCDWKRDEKCVCCPWDPWRYCWVTTRSSVNSPPQDLLM